MANIEKSPKAVQGAEAQAAVIEQRPATFDELLGRILTFTVPRPMAKISAKTKPPVDEFYYAHDAPALPIALDGVEAKAVKIGLSEINGRYEIIIDLDPDGMEPEMNKPTPDRYSYPSLEELREGVISVEGDSRKLSALQAIELYEETAWRLLPEEAKILGFPQEFVERLRATPATV